MNPITTESEQEESGFASPRLGHVRWIICAMLFFTISINYMDRLVEGKGLRDHVQIDPEDLKIGEDLFVDFR